MVISSFAIIAGCLMGLSTPQNLQTPMFIIGFVFAMVDALIVAGLCMYAKTFSFARLTNFYQVRNLLRNVRRIVQIKTNFFRRTDNLLVLFRRLFSLRFQQSLWLHALHGECHRHKPSSNLGPSSKRQSVDKEQTQTEQLSQKTLGKSEPCKTHFFVA